MCGRNYKVLYQQKNRSDFYSGPSIVEVNIKGKCGPINIKNACYPRWSPDGKHFAFTRYLDHGVVKIFCMFSDKEDVQELGMGKSLSWFPDGEKITFAWIENYSTAGQP